MIENNPFPSLVRVIRQLEAESTEGEFTIEYGMIVKFRLEYVYIIVGDEQILEMKFYVNNDLELWRVGSVYNVLSYFEVQLNRIMGEYYD